jgi:hypothetical protein
MSKRWHLLFLGLGLVSGSFPAFGQEVKSGSGLFSIPTRLFSGPMKVLD